ncbi:MAG: nuclear transport factor 2 family protein [Cytophagales bacterium]|nr:nuclear transport factor 2 family protein [Cytophagales bacterium]
MNPFNIVLKTYLKLLSVIPIVFLGCIGGNLQNAASTNEEEVLLARINEFNLAFKSCDIELLKSMISENYQHTNGNSKSITKEAWFDYLEKRKLNIESSELTMTSYEMTEVEMEVYDDMAIITGKISTSSVKLGEEQENEYRITNVWIKEAGSWKRAGFHDGKIK